MDNEQLIAAVKAKFPEIAVDAAVSNLPTIIVPLGNFRALMEFLHNDASMKFDYPDVPDCCGLA